MIPAHNPRVDYLGAVFDGLRDQSLPLPQWELIVVDNRSEQPLTDRLDLAWHPGAKIVREESLGLTHARVAGFGKALGDLVVFVDDDNVLAADYLEQASRISVAYPFIAVWGGAIRPQYEDASVAPPASLQSLLTLRDVEADLWSNDPGHHASTPWGAGLCVRRTVAARYVEELAANPRRYALDLRGNALVYGGDTDIAYTACRMGQAKGVFHELEVTHLIEKKRCTEEHLCQVAYGRGYSEVLHHYSLTGALPARYAGVMNWLRTQYRRRSMSSLERAVEKAAERGRSAAFREFSAAA